MRHWFREAVDKTRAFGSEPVKLLENDAKKTGPIAPGPKLLGERDH